MVCVFFLCVCYQEVGASIGSEVRIIDKSVFYSAVIFLSECVYVSVWFLGGVGNAGL